MSVKKNIAIVLAVLTAGIASSRAADIYGGYKDRAVYVPTPGWGGFYLGVHFGGAWMANEPAGNVLFLGGSPGTILIDRNVDTSGVMGGVQAGYNFTFGNFLLGIESDFGGMANSGSRAFVDASTPARVLRVGTNDGWYGDVTMRAGLIYDRTL